MRFVEIINNYKSKINTGYSLSSYKKPIKYKISELETVRNSLHMRPILEAMASDCSSLEFTCEGDPVLVELWQPFLERQFKKVIKELIVWSWVYGEAIADLDIQLMLTSNGVYKYVRNMQPLDMSKIERKDDCIKYGQFEAEYDRLFALILFEEAGQVFPNGMLYKKAVDSLEILTQGWTQSTAANSVGILVVYDLPGVVPNPTIMETGQELNDFIQGHGNQIGMAFELPPGKDAKIIASPSTNDFEKPIVYNTYLILSGLRSQFVASQIIAGGGNYNVSQHKAMYLNYINYLADMVCESLTYLAYKVMSWEGQDLTGEIVFKHSEANTETLTGEFANAIKTITEINGLTQEQKDVLFKMMGLPTSEVQALPESNEIILQSDFVLSRLKAKQDSALISFKKYVLDSINGKRMHYKLSNSDSIAIDLHLDDEQTIKLKSVWGSLGDNLNAIIKTSKNLNEAVTRYHQAWESLKNEVLKWMS